MATRSGRALVSAARGKTRLVERVDLGRAGRREADSDAIAGRSLTIARLEHEQRRLFLAVEHDRLAKRPEIFHAQWRKRSIVELHRCGKIAGAKAGVREYAVA